jgi:hypothetical protein
MSRESGPVTAADIEMANAVWGRLALSPARMAELTIELGQLRAAIETVRTKPGFDGEPADFRAALLALAGEAGR